MPTTACLSCGLPRAEELVGVAPCPLCGSDGSPPVAVAAPPVPATVAPAPPPRPVRPASRFGLGVAAGVLIGVGAGAGGVIGWQARPTTAPAPDVEVVEAPAPPAEPPPVPAPSPDPAPTPVTPTPTVPTAKEKDKEKPNPFRPVGPPPPILLDNPDGETSGVVRPGGHLILVGKVKRLVVPGLQAGAVLDASRLEAAEVVVVGPIDGAAKLIVRAAGGSVRLRGKVDGGSVVDVTGRVVQFDEPIGGAGTRAIVTLTSGGELTFAAVGGSSRLEYRRANPADPAPKLVVGRVVPPGVFVAVP